MESYSGFADEVIVVASSLDTGGFVGSPKVKTTIVGSPWPQEFDWTHISHQFQKGYDAATGDWVILCDLDFIFHEQDYKRIRQLFDGWDMPAISFWKYQFVLPDRYNIKSRMVIAVNKGRYGDRIRFDSGGDLCRPSLDGREIKASLMPEARIAIWNYDKILKTEAQVRDDVGRMARAWRRHFNDNQLGGPDDESAFIRWMQMQQGRFNKPQQRVKLEQHPKVMQNTIANLKPEQFGYSGFGALNVNDYAKAALSSQLSS